MRDPLLIDPQGQRIPEEWRRNYSQRAVDRLPGDVMIAFDRIFTLQRDKDRLQSDLNAANKQLERANLKIWVMGLIVSPIVGQIIKAVWSKLFP